MTLSFREYKRYLELELELKNITDIPDNILDDLTCVLMDYDISPNQGAEHILYDTTYGTLQEVYDDLSDIVKDYDEDDNEFEREETMEEFLKRLNNTSSILVKNDNFIILRN